MAVWSSRWGFPLDPGDCISAKPLSPAAPFVSKHTHRHRRRWPQGPTLGSLEEVPNEPWRRREEGNSEALPAGCQSPSSPRREPAAGGASVLTSSTHRSQERDRAVRGPPHPTALAELPPLHGAPWTGNWAKAGSIHSV